MKGWLPSGRSDVFAIIGHPVTQVQSPSLYNSHFADISFDAVFIALDVEPKLVPEYFRLMRGTKNLRGGFVTVPHKRSAADCMDELTPRAEALHAVSVVKNDNGRLIGDMTDGPAFLDATRGRGLEPSGKRVALIGGGSAASAIAHACAEQKVAELVMSVRRRERHEALRAIVESVPNAPSLSFDLDTLDGFDLVINGTSVGMAGDDNVPFPVETMSAHSMVGEVVTDPRVTPWLAAALAKGCKVQYGLDMAKAQTQLVSTWWDIPPPAIEYL